MDGVNERILLDGYGFRVRVAGTGRPNTGAVSKVGRKGLTASRNLNAVTLRDLSPSYSPDPFAIPETSPATLTCLGREELSLGRIG